MGCCGSQRAANNELKAKAKTGDKVAQFNLGVQYIMRNKCDDGMDLLKLSAKQGHQGACNVLGQIYQFGTTHGVVFHGIVDKEEADRWKNMGIKK